MPPSQPATVSAQQQASPQQLNAMQRQAVLAQAVDMTQQINSQTITSNFTAPIQIVPRNVGLIKKFIIEISGTISNGDANLVTLSQFGLANLLSSIQFTDLNNNQRINTSGWHLSLLQSAKYRRPYAGGLGLQSDQMSGFGENYAILKAPATIAAGATATFRAQFEVPLAYNDEDLRGAVFANVVNATMQLQLQLTSNLGITVNADSTLGCYTGAVNGANVVFTTVTVTTYQNYLDQLPIGKTGVVLPILDLSTIYELKTSPFQSITASQDFPIPYANFRDFLSTYVIYYNGTARTAGTDINYWALQSANFTNIWKKDPLLAAYAARMVLGTDPPIGAYYFSSRRKPISTLNYGNMELILNASTAGTGAYALVGWEDMALVNTLTSAGSLAAS